MTMDEQPAKPRSRAFRIRVSILLLIGLVALTQLGRLNQYAVTEGILRSHSPDPEILHQLLGDAPNPGPLIALIWETEKLPHRWEIINYLNRNLGARPELVPIIGNLVLEAANDPDVTLRLTALNLLRVLDHPEWQGIAQAALNDPDPVVNDIARAVLKDVDSEIEVPVKQYPHVNQVRGSQFDHLGFNDFAHQPYALSQFEGRPILLHFFATWSPECTKEISDLLELRNIAPSELIILGVNIDGVPGIRHDHCETDCDHEEECEHDHGSATLSNIFKTVERHVIINEYNYPIVFDTNGLATAQLEGSELPVHVLLDSDHHLLRRYAGTRSARIHDHILRTLLGIEGTPATTNEMKPVHTASPAKSQEP
jgi:thiol-disulfide isomerase/thioredoxin